MSETQDIVTRPCPGISPEEAREARARAWLFVFDCMRRKETAEANNSQMTQELKVTTYKRRPVTSRSRGGPYNL
jgi:hypothetical protein